MLDADAAFFAPLALVEAAAATPTGPRPKRQRSNARVALDDGIAARPPLLGGEARVYVATRQSSSRRSCVGFFLANRGNASGREKDAGVP